MRPPAAKRPSPEERRENGRTTLRGVRGADGRILRDPLGALDTNFWGLGNEGTIGYLRHAEIKHGRVAMAAFLGQLAQSTPLVSGPHKILPFKGYTPGLSPPEQWDAIPLVGKLQIITFIGMLESYGEILAPHYTKGGLPGYYPPIKGKRPELVFNLYDPFGFFKDNSEEKKARGRLSEVRRRRRKRKSWKSNCVACA